MSSSPTVHLALEEARALTHRVLTVNGCDTPNTDAVCDVIMAAEADRCYSHGLFRLPGYIASLRSGKVNGKAQPTVSELAPAALRIDGDGGFTPLALVTGRDPLTAKAKSQGIAALAITKTYHFAALWPETAALSEQGLAAFAMTSSKPSVAPAGGTRPLFGTNPIAFSWPRSGHPPMVFDLATAAMARGEIMIAAREGELVRDGAGLDKDGRPTNDPSAILEGAQLAFDGYKGALFALMVELLAGPLIGEAFSVEQAALDNDDGGPAIGGELVIAIDPVRLSGSGTVFDHAEKLFAEVLAQEGTRLPSDRRYKNREETARDGIEVPATLYETICSLQ